MIRAAAGRLRKAARRRILPLIRPAEWRDWSRLALADPAQVAMSLDPGLYADGLLYDEDQLLRLLPLPGAGARELFPPYRYRRPPPELFGAGAFANTVLAECARQTRIHPRGAATVESVLPEALLFGDAVYVRQGDTLLALHESARANDRTALRPPTAKDLRSVQVIDVAEPVFLGSPGGGNFGHWLVDDLTRISDSPATWLLTDHGPLMNARRTESLGLALDAQPTVRFLPHDRPTLVRDLRYASRATYHPALKSPDAIRLAAERVTAALPPPRDTPGRNLFIHRHRERSGRGLLNDAEVAGLLAARGFVTLDPLEANAAEQARACRDADLIVGVMGAAMSNTMFARPGTRTVYLAPTGWVEPFYWDLAAVCDHRYQCLFGETSGTGDPWRLSFRIDPALLAQALDAG